MRGSMVPVLLVLLAGCGPAGGNKDAGGDPADDGAGDPAGDGGCASDADCDDLDLYGKAVVK